MANRRRSKQAWRELIAQWRNSGLSAAEFCAREDVNINRFYKKRRDLGVESNFVAVRISEQPLVLLVGDVSIKCTTSTSVAWLADLVQALRQ